MPRPPRTPLADVPQHIVQRGIDRAPCFFSEVDYVRYLLYLREAAQASRCGIHAYVLMTNHVHLLVTTQVSGGVSKMMQLLGRNYVAYVSRRIGRTGTLWQGRHSARLVDKVSYVMNCYRYIEQNPVRATMVASLADYSWSSYAHNALGRFDPLITPHPVYLDLGDGREERLSAYREFVDKALEDDELESIRTGVGYVSDPC